MTTEQGFRMVTRALVIYSLFWLVDEILLTPTDVIGLVHHIRLLRMVREMDHLITEETYWVRYYALQTFERAIKIGLSLWCAMWFYGGSAKVRKFFCVASDPTPTE